MKRLFITLGLAFGILFFSTGCEEGDRTLPPVIEEPTLHFDREGDYNLSEYLVPNSERINTYQLSEYTDNTGKRSYSDTDKNTSYYSLKYLKPDVNKTEELQDDAPMRVFEVQADRIEEYASEDNRTTEIVKYASVGDYVIINEFTVEEGDKSRKFSMLCQATGHLSDYDKHKDVLRISCDINESNSLTFEGSEGKTIKNGTYDLWFAKGIGMVHSVKDICTETTFDGISKKRCDKEIREWLSGTTI